MGCANPSRRGLGEVQALTVCTTVVFGPRLPSQRTPRIHGTITSSPPCPSPNASACCLTLNWSRCLSARLCTSQGTGRITSIPQHRHRVPAVRHGEWRIRPNRRGRQRGRCGHRPVHGRGNHAESGRGAERGPRLSAEWTAAQSRQVALERAEHDPGADRQHAGGTARWEC
jgi:hypothetical protein